VRDFVRVASGRTPA